MTTARRVTTQMTAAARPGRPTAQMTAAKRPATAKRPTATRRSTAQKELISQTLRCLDHPTAAEVYEAVRKQAPQVSLGTVYRNLNLMAEAGSALRLSMRDEPDRFDPNTHDHHHAVCDSCGRVIDTDSSIPAGLIAQLEQAVEGCTGIRVSRHSLYFRGLCQDCREQDG